MNNREKICVWLFEQSQNPYAKYIKKSTPWGLTNTDLLNFKSDTLGYALGMFLTANNFNLIPKLETHDAYHVITDYGTTVKEEIALQYFFSGNKKRSLYLFGVIFIGVILLPENIKSYYNSYLDGKKYIPFHNWDIKSLLNEPLDEVKKSIIKPEKQPSASYSKKATNFILNVLNSSFIK